MENIEVNASGNAAPNVDTIKANREAYLREYVATLRGERAKGQLSWMYSLNPAIWHACNECGAMFNVARIDAIYCPACRGSDVNILSLDELAGQELGRKVNNMVREEDLAEIEDLRLQKLSKKEIAEKLGIHISVVSEVVGTKKRDVPKERVYYIRHQYLSGRSEWEIKQDIGCISEKRVCDVTAQLRQDIWDSYKEGIRPEDIGKKIGIQGHDPAIIGIIEKAIEAEKELIDLGLGFQEVTSGFMELDIDEVMREDVS
ncbi:MAG TPA: hypothetical protein PLI05_10415 [Methanotrichaceae archaeon]|nr:hypothetical protein [Methanotrichaceae archaeon]HQI92040.1 hypothetical protein [Methanotrichaceae archaeon]